MRAREVILLILIIGVGVVFTHIHTTAREDKIMIPSSETLDQCDFVIFNQDSTSSNSHRLSQRYPILLLLA